MRKRRLKVLNNKYIIVFHIKINKSNKGILTKQNYTIKYFISYYLMRFWPVNGMIGLVLYLFFNVTSPEHVFAYPRGYAYLRLNITGL
jgi:hypothetical protein